MIEHPVILAFLQIKPKMTCYRVVQIPRTDALENKSTVKTLADSLKESGYHTTAIGKWHINSWPDDIGFDHYIIPRHQHANRAQLFTEDGGEEFCPDMSFCVLVPPIILRARRLMLMEDAL